MTRSRSPEPCAGLAWLGSALAADEALDEGAEAARNACVAGAPLAAAVITAAAHADNPLTGARALRACLERIASLPLELCAFERALAPRPLPAADGLPLTPGFGFVLPGRELWFVRLLAGWAERAPEAARSRFFLAHQEQLCAVAGPLNGAGLAAFACADVGLDADAAERQFLLWKIDVALREASAARRAGLRAIPFDGVRYVYEGVLPPPRPRDRRAALRAVGIELDGGPDV